MIQCANCAGEMDELEAKSLIADSTDMDGSSSGKVLVPVHKICPEDSSVLKKPFKPAKIV